MNENKMTQKSAINYVLENCEIPDDVRASLAHIVETMSKPRKKTPNQIENEEKAGPLYDWLINSEDNKYKASEIIEQCPEFADFSVPRMTRVLAILIERGMVKTEKIKGANYYSAIERE